MTARVTAWVRTKVGVAFNLPDNPSREDWRRVYRLASLPALRKAHWSARPVDKGTDEGREP